MGRRVVMGQSVHAQTPGLLGEEAAIVTRHTAVSAVLYAVDKGLRGQNVLHQLLLILLCICS